MNTLNEFICYNQKHIIKFEYEISELHKKFKESFNGKEPTDRINELYENLNIQSFMLMEKIFQKNLEYISNSIGFKDDNLRTTIKIVNERNTIDIFRSHKNKKLFNECSYIQNTAFQEIIDDNKKLFICDNLEELFKRGKYKNPRIDNEKSKLFLQDKISWEDCWISYDDEDNNSYYQSTLVIPMSITNDEIEEEGIFYNNYFSKNNVNKLANKTRVIWGFLCLDSKQKGYFEQIKDICNPIDLGFIISDILSIYLIFFYNYTSASETIQKYEKNLYN